MGRTVSDILGQHGITLSEDELEHAGVKGMRWGRRKKKSSSESDDADSGPPKPNVKTMSDDDLKAAINRIKLEREFTKLTAPEVNRGRKIVGELLLEVGKQQAKSYLNRQVEELLKDGLKSAAKKTAKAGGKLAIEAAVSKAAPSTGRTHVQFARRPGF